MKKMLQTIGLVCLLLYPAILYASGRLPPGDEERGRTGFYRGEFETAIEEYHRLWVRDRKNQALARDLAAALQADQQYHKAQKVLAQAGVRGQLMGEALLAAGDYKEARYEFEYVLEQPGQHGRARLFLGLIDYQQTNYAKAAEHFWKAQEQSPSQGSIHLYLARSFHRLAESATTERDYFVSRANEEFNKTVYVDPSLWQVHRDLALFAGQNEEWEKALKQWKKVKSVIGNAPEVKQALADIRPRIPTPTITPTPAVVIAKAELELPVFEDLQVKPFPVANNAPEIRVGLGKKLPSLAFACMGEWRAVNIRGKQFWQGLAKTGYRIERHPRGGWVLKNWEGKRLKRFRKKMILEPLDAKQVMVVIDLYQNSGYLWSVGRRKNRYYRGWIEIKPRGKRLTLVNQLPMDQYLLSVIPGEMPALWPMEALKTQAVVARTDTWQRRKNHSKEGFGVCSNVHCAMYRGVSAEHARTFQAVVETQGEVLKKGGKYLPAFYSHSCGGITQGHKEAWWKKYPDLQQPQGVYDFAGNTLSVKKLPLSPGEINPWLADSPDVFCNAPKYSAARNFRWTKILTQGELSAVLDRRYGIGTLQQLRITERSPSAYVRRIQVIGSKGKKSIRGDHIRSALGGVRSNLFSVLPIPDPDQPEAAPKAWVIWGGGWGHGVGLCQVGAGSMGRQQYTYQEILQHYFPEGEIQSWK
jgi:SpoIID/LytB domain protein